MKILESTSAFRGTPWYNGMARLCGIDVHAETLLFSPISLVEAHLLHLGKGMVDWGAKLATHYVRDSQYFFKTFQMGDGAWIQANCRVLAPEIIEQGARLMPACTTLPNERITKGTIWGGIPGGPIGEVLLPSIRSRIQSGGAGIVPRGQLLASLSSSRGSRSGLSQRELVLKAAADREEKMASGQNEKISSQQTGSLLRRHGTSKLS